jgi:hypothetical protein
MEIRKHPPSTLKNVDGVPPGGADGDSGASTINAKKCQQWARWDVLPEIQEHPPSTQRMLMAGPQTPMGGSLHPGSESGVVN